MKALVLITSHYDYDGGQIERCRVVMVPDDFNEALDWRDFEHRLRQPGEAPHPGWVTAKGKLHGGYINKARELWELNLIGRFGETKSQLEEWNV